MIIRWIPVAMGHFVGDFNGHTLDIVQNDVAHTWNILVDGIPRGRKNLKTPALAKDYCEYRANKVIVGLAKLRVQAHQLPILKAA